MMEYIYSLHAEFTFLTTPVYEAIKSAAYSPRSCMRGAQRRVVYWPEERYLQMIYLANSSAVALEHNKWQTLPAFPFTLCHRSK